MKQAILITGYKNVELIVDIINYFDENFNFYIHIDKKSDIDISIFEKYTNVFCTKKFYVNWAGFNHVRAILFLSEKAIENKENVFFHLITGQDFPIQKVQTFLNIDITKNYLQHFTVPAPSWGDGYDGGLNRIQLYQFFDFFDAKKKIERKILNMSYRISLKLKLIRKYPSKYPPLYGGSTYWSLNREALEYVVSYTKNNRDFFNRFRYTACSEEFYYQTILMNSHLSSTVVNDDLRHIDWSGENPPKILTNEDFETLRKSGKLFARKFSVEDSSILKQKIINHLANS